MVQLAERLVLLSAKNETFLFTHLVKYLQYLLHNSQILPSPWLNQHLRAFIKFLTLTVKNRGVAKVAEEIAKVRTR